MIDWIKIGITLWPTTLAGHKEIDDVAEDLPSRIGNIEVEHTDSTEDTMSFQLFGNITDILEFREASNELQRLMDEAGG